MKKYVFFIIAAIAVVMSFDFVPVQAAMYRIPERGYNIRSPRYYHNAPRRYGYRAVPYVNRPVRYVRGNGHSYRVQGGGYYLSEYNCTVWGTDLASPWFMNIGGRLSVEYANGNVFVTEPNGQRVIIGCGGEKRYVVDGYYVDVSNHDNWPQVYITNPYGYKKQFLLIPYQIVR